MKENQDEMSRKMQAKQDQYFRKAAKFQSIGRSIQECWACANNKKCNLHSDNKNKIRYV